LACLTLSITALVPQYSMPVLYPFYHYYLSSLSLLLTFSLSLFHPSSFSFLETSCHFTFHLSSLSQIHPFHQVFNHLLQISFSLHFLLLALQVSFLLLSRPLSSLLYSDYFLIPLSLVLLSFGLPLCSLIISSHHFLIFGLQNSSKPYLHFSFLNFQVMPLLSFHCLF